MKLKKIISGGQTGADQGAIFAAIEWNSFCPIGNELEVGGYMPKGFITEEGPSPWLADWGLVEIETNSYPLRTAANIRAADATLRFAHDWSSRGEQLTKRLAVYYDRPYLDVSVYAPIPVDKVIDWIDKHSIKILNVAGNRESIAMGIHDFTVAYLLDVFLEMTTIPA